MIGRIKSKSRHTLKGGESMDDVFLCQICKEPIHNFVSIDKLSSEISDWLPREVTREFQIHNKSMMEIFHMQLCERTGHSDEQTMTLCYDRYPELFTIYNGDYYSILTNYHDTTTDLSAIKYHFIYNTMNANRYDLAKLEQKWLAY